LILGVLALALSMAAVSTASATTEAQASTPAAATSDAGCTKTAQINNDQFAWHSLLDVVTAQSTCDPVPATVVIVKERSLPGDVAGSPALNVDHAMGIATSRLAVPSTGQAARSAP
jgi:hypothetical protein